MQLSVYPKNEPSAKKLFCNDRGLLLLLFSNAIINEMEKSSNELWLTLFNTQQKEKGR